MRAAGATYAWSGIAGARSPGVQLRTQGPQGAPPPHDCSDRRERVAAHGRIAGDVVQGLEVDAGVGDHQGARLSHERRLQRNASVKMVLSAWHGRFMTQGAFDYPQRLVQASTPQQASVFSKEHEATVTSLSVTLGRHNVRASMT